MQPWQNGTLLLAMIRRSLTSAENQEDNLASTWTARNYREAATQ